MGYFDKEQNQIFIARKLGQIVWGRNGGKPDAFDKFWPLPDSDTDPVKKVWGLTEEDARQTRELIMRSHKVLK